MRLSVLTGVFMILCGVCQAQHTVDFTASASACRNELIGFDNQSDMPASIDWNFCASDLNGTYTSLAFGVISIQLTALEIVNDNGTWYGFAATRSTGELFRLNFGSDPFNPDYTKTSLGNFSGLLAMPDGISIVKDGNDWYGLVTDLSTDDIVRLHWTSLASAPTAASLNLNATGKLFDPSQIEIHKDNNEFIAVVANGTGSKVTMINFHASMTTTPTGADVIESVAFPGAGNMYGVSATRQCDQWEIYTIADNKMYRAVVPALFTSIAGGQIQDFTSSIPFSIGQFNRIRTIKYFDRTYFYFTSFTAGYVSGASWQTGEAAPVMVNMGSLTVPPNPYSLALFKNGDAYGMFTGGFNAGQMRGIQLSSTCGASKKHGTEFRPTDVSYPAAGNYRIALNMTYSDGQTCSKSQDIVITPADAPTFDFSYDNICESSTTTFDIESSETLTAIWAYGDGGSGTTGIHSYTADGTYEVGVEVVAPNSCKNRLFREIEIYDPPVAAFQLPTGQICTNNEFTFVNNTADGFDGNLAYEWQVDGAVAGTTRDLHHTFSAVGDKSIKLIVSIPGCFDDNTQVVTGLLPGPTVGFTVNGQCVTQAVNFVNSSTGDIAGFEWSFGDGAVSTATSPAHSYSTIGSFTTALETTGTNGCVSSTSKTFDIFSLPAPAFSLDLPPFSCAGTPSQFHDATPVPTDSNVNQWTWNFGDNGTGTGEDPVHTYAAAGSFNVRLSVSTDKGCMAFNEQQVSIAPSPVASFTSDPTCLGQSTRFTSTSSGVKSWTWRMGSSTYTVENPVHVFSATGNTTVQLTVMADNNCVNTITKPVVVPVVPTLDFKVANACSGQAAVFTDLSSSPADPITQRTWTFNGGTSTGTETSFTVPNAGGYPARLQIQNQSGCVYSLVRSVTIQPSPVPSFTMSDQSGPPPLRVVFTNTSTGAATYRWDFHDGAAPKTEASTEHIFNSLGQHQVDLTAISTAACARTLSRTIDVIIPYDELSLEEFSVIQQPGGAYRGFVRVRNGGNYRVTSFGVTYSAGGSVMLQETVTGSLSPGQTTLFPLSNLILDPGSGFLCAELPGDNILINNKACASIGGASVAMVPYPNPADQVINIETVHAAAGVLRVRLYSLSGGNAYDRMFDVEAGLSRLTIDVQNLAPGLYVAVVTGDGLEIAERVLIAR